jgi:hypothetical protein
MSMVKKHELFTNIFQYNWGSLHLGF